LSWFLISNKSADRSRRPKYDSFTFAEQAEVEGVEIRRGARVGAPGFADNIDKQECLAKTRSF
jgi:hypothetical protein